MSEQTQPDEKPPVAGENYPDWESSEAAAEAEVWSQLSPESRAQAMTSLQQRRPRVYALTKSVYDAHFSETSILDTQAQMLDQGAATAPGPCKVGELHSAGRFSPVTDPGGDLATVELKMAALMAANQKVTLPENKPAQLVTPADLNPQHPLEDMLPPLKKPAKRIPFGPAQGITHCTLHALTRFCERAGVTGTFGQKVVKLEQWMAQAKPAKLKEGVSVRKLLDHNFKSATYWMLGKPGRNAWVIVTDEGCLLTIYRNAALEVKPA